MSEEPTESDRASSTGAPPPPRPGAGAVPPGPSPWKVLWNLRRVLGTPLPWWTGWRAAYGDVVRLDLGVQAMTLLFHPDHVERVLQGNQRNYVRSGYGYQVLRLVQGDGLLTSDGELWRRQRRLMQPIFHRRNLERFVPAVIRLTRTMLERWEDHADRGEPVDIYREMIALAVRILGETMASLDMSGRLEELEPARDVCNEEVTRRMTDPLQLPLWVPTARNRAFRAALATFDRLSHQMIAERRASTGEAPHDFLTLMLAARDEETGEPMSDALLRDEIVTMAGAGNETSGLSLSWLFYELARNPPARERLAEEVAARLGGRDPEVEDLDHLPHTLACFQEALRLYPPIYGIPRQAVADDVVDGFVIRAGSDVLLSQYVTHRHPGFWERPDDFLPERFAPGADEGRHRFAYFPFGGGSHLCIGRPMAIMDAQLVVAMIAQRFHLDLVDDAPVGIRAGITIRPDRRILMVPRRVA